MWATYVCVFQAIHSATQRNLMLLCDGIQTNCEILYWFVIIKKVAQCVPVALAQQSIWHCLIDRQLTLLCSVALEVECWFNVYFAETVLMVIAPNICFVLRMIIETTVNSFQVPTTNYSSNRTLFLTIKT